MNYFEHNDEKGREARIRTAINRAERARMAQPFDGTLYMSKWDVVSARAVGWVQSNVSRRVFAPLPGFPAYLDGRRVSRAERDAAHLGRRTDSYASRMETRRDGAVMVREYHCIRRERRGE